MIKEISINVSSRVFWELKHKGNRAHSTLNSSYAMVMRTRPGVARDKH